MIRNLILCLLVILTSCSTLALKEVNLSDNGWNVWLDKEAGWKNDSLYAPGETELFKLYVNQPTGGWDILKEDKTVTCTLPATVEELFSKGDQYFRYHGVSWFWKEINVPTSWKGKVIRLNVEKAQFRTELYINKQLAGYDIVPETPFGFDITPYLKFGQKNLIAFRLTNPGGTRGWEDTGKMTWGKYNIFAIHDFTCLGHVNLNITDAVYVNNIFVKNQLPAGSRELEVIIDIQNLKNTTEQGKLIVTINPKTGGDALFYKTYSVAAKPGSSIHSYRIVIPEARLWDIETPVLYTCRADINFNGMNDSGQAYFGFRTFEVCNIDGFHYFYFNGKRIRHRSAIDRGYYALTGGYATPGMALKSVKAAKAIGHNGINFHRRIGELLVFEYADELGLYLYEEPRAFHTQKNNERHNFKPGSLQSKINLERCRRMVIRDRNHPSLIICNISNEDNIWGKSGRSNKNKIMEEIHPTRIKAMKLISGLDDSRLIVNSSGGNNGSESGFVPHIRPYETEIRWDFQDDHTVGAKNRFQEDDLQSHNKVLKNELFYYGEVRCYTGPDNWVEITEMKERLANNQAGYDLGSFSPNNDLFQQAFKKYQLNKIGSKVIQNPTDIPRQAGRGLMYINGRLGQRIMVNNHCSGYAINGWSAGSFAQQGDNGYWNWASALVDEGRNLKGPADEMAYWTRDKQVAIFRKNGKYFKPGQTVEFEIFIINENRLPAGDYMLQLTVSDGSGEKKSFGEKIPVRISSGDVFAQKVMDVEFPLSDKFHGGYITLNGELIKDGEIFATGNEQVLLANRNSYKKDLQYLTGTVINWPAAQKALIEAEVKLQKFNADNLSFIVAGQTPEDNELDNILKQVEENGTMLIVKFDSIWANTIYTKGILSEQINQWGGKQVGHWRGNGWGYIDHFVGKQSIPSKSTIGTTSWEVPSDPVGFYPFESKYKLGAYGLYMARPKLKTEPTIPALLVLIGTIDYGKGKIILCPGYHVDQNNAFTDMLFYNMIKMGCADKW